MKLLLTVLLGMSCIASADIYRWVDEQGRVNYSDEPHPGAERLEVPEPPSYSPPKMTDIPVTIKKKEQDNAFQIVIDSPKPDIAVWVDGNGLPVSVSVKPEWNPKNRQQIIVMLDGKVVGEPESQLNFVIPLVERGQHTLQVSLQNQKKQNIATSEVVTFQAHRPVK